MNQIKILQDLGYDLWDEPLDQHIEYAGDYYHHPGLPDSLNYFYTLIPDNYSIPQDVPSAVISQVILFDDNAGDEQDIEEDPWIPDPDNCPDPNNPNCPCYEGPCARKSGEGKVDLREDLVKKTTKYLLEGGVDPSELYNEMMILAGYEDEVSDTDAFGRTMGGDYHPAGRIMVHDNSINLDVPVKGTFIKARRFLKLANTYTNENGYFHISKGFRKKAQVIVKFKNNWVKIRNMNDPSTVDMTRPVKVKLGLFEKHAMENITYMECLVSKLISNL